MRTCVRCGSNNLQPSKMKQRLLKCNHCGLNFNPVRKEITTPVVCTVEVCKKCGIIIRV
jgi:transcription elongation factor Elf1